jgi:hypothetical protein
LEVTVESLEEIRRDFSAFADDDADVAIDVDGTVVYVQGGEERQVEIQSSPSAGMQVLTPDGGMYAYKDFLARRLGRLDVLAERLLSRRSQVPGTFVDGPAVLDRAGSGRLRGHAVGLLDDECRTPPPFAVRLTFLTADAGHGKSALLRQYQQDVAQDFLANRAPYLFWHVDLQGRQLLRLSEALMGDLGDLRVPGLWVAGIHRLVRAGVLVLAIDGFDELAAEQGSTDALGALATLIRELGGHGTVLAASRRAFFDSQDYLQRAGAFRRTLPENCQFDQIELLPWTANEGLEYFHGVALDGETFDQPEATYTSLVEALGGEPDHPILTRPFLLYQAARALLLYGLEPESFVRSMDDPRRGVASVVEAFIDREVADKWRNRETGEPYLTRDQHIAFLGDAAEEMYRSSRDRLSLDVVETLMAMRLEEWDIGAGLRQQIMEMVRVHVLLRPPFDGDSSQRNFDHPEFRDYFIAQALMGRLTEAALDEDEHRLVDFLSMATLPDATARYVSGMISLSDAQSRSVIEVLARSANQQWKPTHLQVNSGTLIPHLAAGRSFDPPLIVDGKSVVYSSLVFRGLSLENVVLRGGQFLNVWLQDSTWSRVAIEKVQVGELAVDKSNTVLRDVKFSGCEPFGIRLLEAGEEVERAYAPSHVEDWLMRLGVSLESDDRLAEDDGQPTSESQFAKQVHRLLRHFYRSTVVTSYELNQRFRHADVDPQRIVELMVEHGILRPDTWKGGGHGAVWRLDASLEDVLRAEEGAGPSGFVRFWDAVRKQTG